MFGFGKKNAKIAFLSQELAAASDNTDMLQEMVSNLNRETAKLYDRIKELEDVERNNAQLQAETRKLQAENAQLRNGAGHALHALAAVQDLSTAFVKRLDMLPPYCGLPQDLVQSVFESFDKDLQARKDLAWEIKKQSFTFEAYADDKGLLQNGPDDNTTRFITPVDIHDVFFGPDSRIDTQIQIDPSQIQDLNIHELGLYAIQIDLGKNVTAEAKLWIIPNAEGLTE